LLGQSLASLTASLWLGWLKEMNEEKNLLNFDFGKEIFWREKQFFKKSISTFLPNIS